MRRAVSVLVLLAGCTSSPPGDHDPSADATPFDRADASEPIRADAGPGSCLAEVPDDYGSNGAIDESQFSIDGDFTYYADMAPETERMQRLFVSLHPQMGVFTGDVVPGTYVLDGDENDYSWCGACVYLAVDDDGSAPSVLYMAQTGKLTIDSVDTEIHGTLENAVLTRIDMVASGPSCADWMEGDPWPCGNSACLGSTELCEVQDLVPDCRTRFDSFSF